MSQVSLKHGLTALIMTLVLLGCSSPNDQSHFNSDIGKHVDNWLPAGHMTAANTDLTTCADCHGADYSGGVSGVSCTSCHLGSPTSVHPANWTPVYSTHGSYVSSNGTSPCSNQYCHGTSLTGVPDSGPSCTACHLGSPTSVHPAGWNPIVSTHGPYVKANTTSPCANQYCHGVTLTGVTNSGPSCTSCHIGGITSGHPSNWVPVYSTHGPYVNTSPTGTTGCANQSCHGAALTGVPDSGPSCTLCHLGGPTTIHPSNWSPIYSTHGPYVNTSPTRTTACANQYCHGAFLTGVPDSGPSCTSCHMGGVTNIHPAGWLGDACSNHGTFVLTSPSGTSGCANAYCHGTNLGGVPQSGPSCTKCHPTIPTSPSCGTCHGIPPAGTADPNIAGKHAKHMALYGVTCTACHKSSCDQHMNGTVDVIFDAVYNAKSGTGSFNATAKTCSEISCHGGPRTQTLAQGQQIPPQSDPAQTPDWYTGSITVSDKNQCKSCHIYGTTEYNSYLSGKHYKHVVEDGRACDICHDTIKLSDRSTHFAGLATSVISAGTASATTWSWLNYNGTTCTYAACHSGETRTWW